jgi:hypothetical protein
MKEKKDSANNSFTSNQRSGSPINYKCENSNIVKASPKMMKVVVGGNVNSNQLQLNNNMSFKPDGVKSLTPTNDSDKSSINYISYYSNNGSTNTGFYNKMLHNSNTTDVRKLAETKRSLNDKYKKDKVDMEMKMLEEDYNEENLKESYYNNNKKEEEKERERQSIQQAPKKKSGILNLFSKILHK